MSTYTNIPNITLSNQFGKVSKIVWFEVQNSYHSFDLNLFIEPKATEDINLEIFNYGTKETLYKKTYVRRPNNSTTTINETIKLLHIPTKMSTKYGLIIL